MGKIIVIEGTDGSGKTTQIERLYNRLKDENEDIIKIKYPHYESPSSALVKMYLNGEFGDKPEDVNPYTASAFFAVDRIAYYKKEWGKFYNKGSIVLADRYTTSNMIHQAAKIEDKDEKEKFLNWLWDLEFVKMGLPVPDIVIFLNMPPKYSIKLVNERGEDISAHHPKDIHEKDENYLKHSYENSLYIANKYNWIDISCVRDGKIKSIDEIHEEIYSKVKKSLKK